MIYIDLVKDMAVPQKILQFQDRLHSPDRLNENGISFKFAALTLMDSEVIWEFLKLPNFEYYHSDKNKVE